MQRKSLYNIPSLLPILLFSLVSFLLFLTTGCDRSYQKNPELMRINQELSDSETSKEKACSLLNQLTAMDSLKLSDSERHYRDFLIIKSSDKAYITHTSDSLYLTVKDYFSTYYHKEIMPEVLYYGGRVYSDLGVYPVALEHFEEALDHMGNNPNDPGLRRRTLSQTGRLLSKLRIHDQGLKYVEESLEVGKNMGDTLSRIYNLELAGDIATRLNDYHKALKYFEEACKLSKDRYPQSYAINRFRTGYTIYKDSDITGALNIFREVIGDVDSVKRNFALPVISQAYLAAGFPDTAYRYAKELIGNNDPLNREIGFSVLLSDKVRPMIPAEQCPGI